MAFKTIQQTTTVPDSPEKLFLDLPRRKIPDVLAHQQEIMRIYHADALEDSDVALQLPTGSGKTLVGLLIAEWRRRKYCERVVYLAPTKQLVNQITEQANEKYGLTVEGFVGSARDYDPSSKANYKSRTHIAVTTYSSVFNSSPYFDDADVLILDDVHSAENYIASLWSLRIDRKNAEHEALHAAICSLLHPLLQPFMYSVITGQVEGTDSNFVDKLPTPDFVGIRDQLTEILDKHVAESPLAYVWQMLRDRLSACHLYFSPQEILIRPLIPPTWTHAAFDSPKQRIYMSATLGEGGDLERLVGRSIIKRLPVSAGWDRHGVGRRFFIFPEMSLTHEQSSKLRLEMMKKADRSLVLVPSKNQCSEIQEDITNNLGYQVFSSDDIEGTKTHFTSSTKSVAVVANRYDGIDFPGDECRLLFIEGLPRATNLQERFLMSRMGASVIYNERIQTRVLQAIGRCTRSLEDYSAVIVTGNELPDYLADKQMHKFFHPELQAELIFGVEQSKEMDSSQLLENLELFLENGKEWEQVSQQIVSLRKDLVKEPFPAIEELQQAVGYEISYQKSFWQEDYEAALGHADKVLTVIKASDLQGYRALWHYLAGSAALLSAKSGSNESMYVRAADEFGRAKKAATAIPWLVPLSKYSGEEVSQEELDDSSVLAQVEQLGSVLASLGTTYDRKYAENEKVILDGLHSSNSKQFELSHMLLGKLLGFEADNKETDGAPDPWWISANICLVFEDHSDANNESILSVKKARQVASHPSWMRTHIEAASEADIVPVLITPVKKVKEAALSSLKGVCIWDLDEFRTWAKKALTIIRELRTSFTEPGDLQWRATALARLKQNSFDSVSLVAQLRKMDTSKLQVIK